MLAARLHAPGEPLRIEELPLPEPLGAQVRVKVAGCGVCRTDLHIASGLQTRVELPLTLGHEVAGWIDATGRDADPVLRQEGLAIGDPVIVYGSWGCLRCELCEAGMEQLCPSVRSPGFQVNGGYAEAMLVPDASYLFPLGDLAPVRAGPLADAGATSYRAVRRALRRHHAGLVALVIGVGGLGQFAIQHLRAMTAAEAPDMVIAALDVDTRKAAVAQDLGADLALSDPEPATVRRRLGRPAYLVFDFVGTDATLRLAASVVAPDGVVVLVGEGGGSLDAGFETLPVEASFTTVSWCTSDDLRDVVQLARAGKLRWDVETLPLSEAAEAHARLERGDVRGRLVLVPPG